MAAPSSVSSTTLRLLIDKLQDNSFISHPLFQAVEEAGNLKRVSGGQRVEQPVIIGEQSSGLTQVSSGWEPTPLNFSDPFLTANFEWCDIIDHVGLNIVEKTSNKGELARVNILESKIKNLMIYMRLAITRRIFQGPVATTGAASRLTNLQTLNGCTTASSNGWFEAVASGSQQNTVGGLAKTTYRAQNWYNQFQDVNVRGGGALSLNDIDALFINCMQFNPDGSPPDMLFLSPAAYSAFMALIQGQTRYTTAAGREGLDAGMVAEFRGARVYVDNRLGFTAQNPNAPVSGYALTSSQFEVYTDESAFFEVHDPMPVPGTATEAWQVHTRLQITTGRLACHGILFDAEA